MPWKFEAAKEVVAEVTKVAFPNPGNALIPGQSRPINHAVVQAPDFDDPEAECFWNEYNDCDDVQTGGP